ncbi:MAG: hypothetical protein V3V61_07990 [Gammaproteobacteria bacterium]
MKNTFKSIISHLVDEGICGLGDLTPMDNRCLTAALIRDSADPLGQWEFISEPSGSDALPQLLIDVLEENKNGVLGLCRPDTSLVLAMAQGAIEWSQPIIVCALQEAVSHLITEEEE